MEIIIIKNDKFHHRCKQNVLQECKRGDVTGSCSWRKRSDMEMKKSQAKGFCEHVRVHTLIYVCVPAGGVFIYK